MGLRVIQRTGGKEKRCKSLNATLLLQMEGEMEGTGLIFSCDTENTNPWTFRSTGCIRGKEKDQLAKGNYYSRLPKYFKMEDDTRYAEHQNSYHP